MVRIHILCREVMHKVEDLDATRKGKVFISSLACLSRRFLDLERYELGMELE